MFSLYFQHISIMFSRIMLCSSSSSSRDSGYSRIVVSAINKKKARGFPIIHGRPTVDLYMYSQQARIKGHPVSGKCCWSAIIMEHPDCCTYIYICTKYSKREESREKILLPQIPFLIYMIYANIIITWFGNNVIDWLQWCTND